MLLIRAIQPFQPTPNTTTVLINHTPLNLTTLSTYNYTLYTNNTLSNGSSCYLAFSNFHPTLSNTSTGTFINATSCYAPIHQISTHASVGLAFALLFTLCIVLALVNLRKHGRRYMPKDRFSLLARKVQWCWMLVVAVAGAVACFMSVDVDRDYLQNTPLELQSVFYTLLLPTVLAAVWESVRNWATFHHRQITSLSPSLFKPLTPRSFILPLLFYTLTLTLFILTIPRPWTSIQLQRSPEQSAQFAEPAATDSRFKSGAFLALGALGLVAFRLVRSIYRTRYLSLPYTRDGNGREVRVRVGYYVVLTLLTIHISYIIASTHHFPISPYNISTHPAYLYGLGYTPILLILLILNIAGLTQLNEDEILLMQREVRDEFFAARLGYAERPAWWGNGPVRAWFLRQGLKEEGMEMGLLKDVQEEGVVAVKEGSESNQSTLDD